MRWLNRREKEREREKQNIPSFPIPMKQFHRAKHAKSNSYPKYPKLMVKKKFNLVENAIAYHVVVAATITKTAAADADFSFF